MLLCLLDFCNQVCPNIPYRGSSEFQLTKGCWCKMRIFQEPVRWVHSWINVCMCAMKLFTWWQCQEDDYMDAPVFSFSSCCCTCFLLQLGLSTFTLPWEFKIPAGKRVLMQIAHLQESVRWVHSYISLCVSAMRHLILHGRWQCQEGYEHAPPNSSFHLASEDTFFTTICLSLFHLPLEISSRNPSQRSTVGNWWS